MEKVEKPGFKLIGLRLLEKTTNQNGKSNIDCGNLWQEFEKGQQSILITRVTIPDYFHILLGAK